MNAVRIAFNGKLWHFLMAKIFSKWLRSDPNEPSSKSGDGLSGCDLAWFASKAEFDHTKHSNALSIRRNAFSIRC